jgi:hypothetical protein
MHPFFIYSSLSLIVQLAQIHLSTATPFLVDKRCDNACGYYTQLCCEATQTCGTNTENQAVCLDSENSGGSSGVQYYTTVYTSDNVQTVTSVWSSLITSSPGGSSGDCDQSLGESICGTSCCGADEVCTNDVCVGGSSSAAVVPATTTGATPPLRPTSSGATTVTEAPSTTVPFIAPVGTNGATIVVQASGGGGLSGGQIAGIVIGVILGICLLILVLLCICAKELFDGLLALVGLGPRKKTETTYVEEHYSHHSGSRPERRTWFGIRPSRPPPSTSEKKSSGLGFWATLLLIVGAIALCLGLRKKKEQDDRTESGYDDYYTYYSEEYTSASKLPPFVISEA